MCRSTRNASGLDVFGGGASSSGASRRDARKWSIALLRAIAPSHPRKLAAVRRPRSCRIAERNTSCTRSSASLGGTRARRIACTMRAYLTYSSPNAERSPSAAARIRPSSSEMPADMSISCIIPSRLLQHSVDIRFGERLHLRFGMETVDSLRSGRNHRIGKQVVRARFGLDHPLSFLRPLLGECIHSRFAELGELQRYAATLAIDDTHGIGRHCGRGRIVAACDLERYDRVGLARLGAGLGIPNL